MRIFVGFGFSLAPFMRDIMTSNEDKIMYVKFNLEGKPLEIVRELKRRCIVKSAREAMVKGLLVLWDQQMARDLREAQAQTSSRIAAA